MRISDWSSDVCSSDLAVLHRGRRDEVLARRDAAAILWEQRDATAFDPGELARRAPLVATAVRARDPRPARRDDHCQRQHARAADAAEEIGFVFGHGGALWPW